MRYLVASAAIVGAIASAAPAAITASWVAIGSGNGSVGSAYPAAAITADPALSNMQTWDLMVTYDAGDWGSAGLRAQLPAGNTFYRSTNSGITKPEVIAANREFWTYVSAPRDNGESNVVQVLSGFPAGEPTSNGTANGTNIPGLLSAAYGDLVVDPPGTYQIARLTFPLGVLPTIQTGSDPATASHTTALNPQAVAFIPQIPEPASLGLVAVAGLLGVRRRRN